MRSHGGPMLRVKRDDLAARGVERLTDRVTGVRDGRPVVGDQALDVATVVWATGFRQVFDWIHAPVVGADGWPVEMRGVVEDLPGLFFCGLCFQYAFSSMVLPGVGRDADFVAERIAERAESPGRRPGRLTGGPRGRRLGPGGSSRWACWRISTALGRPTSAGTGPPPSTTGPASTRAALSADDLVALGTAAYLVGRLDDATDALQRAYRLYLERRRPPGRGPVRLRARDVVLGRRRAGHGRRLGRPRGAAPRRPRRGRGGAWLRRPAPDVRPPGRRRAGRRRALRRLGGRARAPLRRP